MSAAPSDQAADAYASSQTRSQGEQLIEDLLHFRAQISDRIAEVSELTTSEVLKVGDLVNDIVEDIRAHVQENESLLQRLSDDTGSDSISSAIRRQSDSTEQFWSWVSQRSQKQANTAAQAIQHCKGILHAGEQINELTLNARVLTINIMIQAAHLGERGQSVMVIAHALKQFSQLVEETNTLIENLTSSLLHLLPELHTQATELNEGADAFRDELTARLKEVQQGTNMLRETSRTASTNGEIRLESILSRTLDVLSHLQFQDPMIQHLQQLDPIMGELIVKASQDLNVEVDPDKARSHRYRANLSTKMDADEQENILEEGELMLF